MLGLGMITIKVLFITVLIIDSKEQ